MGLERQGVADAAADAVERELQVPDRGGVAGLDRGEGGGMHGLGALHRHLGQPVEHARGLPGIGRSGSGAAGCGVDSECALFIEHSMNDNDPPAQ